MSEPQSIAADAPLDSSVDFSALITSLRAAGAGRFDPMRMHYIDVLAKRASIHQGSVKRIIEAKVLKEMAAFQKRFDIARCNAQEVVTQTERLHPHAANELKRLFAAGDFRELRQFAASLQSREACASLGVLVRRLEQYAVLSADARSNEHAIPRSELKTIRNFRSTWSKLSVGKQVSQALQQAPKNAGPINSHMLMLRSLTLMQEIAPDYLNHFMSYADTLLCLEHNEKEKPGNPKKLRGGRNKPTLALQKQHLVGRSID